LEVSLPTTLRSEKSLRRCHRRLSRCPRCAHRRSQVPPSVRRRRISAHAGGADSNGVWCSRSATRKPRIVCRAEPGAGAASLIASSSVHEFTQRFSRARTISIIHTLSQSLRHQRDRTSSPIGCRSRHRQCDAFNPGHLGRPPQLRQQWQAFSSAAPRAADSTLFRDSWSLEGFSDEASCARWPRRRLADPDGHQPPVLPKTRDRDRRARQRHRR